MKKILFLMMTALTIALLNACSNGDEDKDKSWTQKKTEEQEEMYEKVKTNIVGQWKE